MLIAMGLAFANLATFLAELVWVVGRYEDEHPHGSNLIGQDIWWPLFLGALLQTAANGLALTAGRSTRHIGLGLLLGAAAAFAVLVAWLWFVLLPAVA